MEMTGTCPHCGSQLKNWQAPPEAAWKEEFFLVCFNDDCSYYREGWSWMAEKFGQKASYRYALSPLDNAPLMIPVWSSAAARDLIVEQNDTRKANDER